MGINCGMEMLVVLAAVPFKLRHEKGNILRIVNRCGLKVTECGCGANQSGSSPPCQNRNFSHRINWRLPCHHCSRNLLPTRKLQPRHRFDYPPTILLCMFTPPTTPTTQTQRNPSTQKYQRSMPGPFVIGLGIAAAAFFGRAGYVAFRKSRGGITQAGALGKAFYKGGFEPKMNRREASLILQLK